jgi:hypothetical protein
MCELNNILPKKYLSFTFLKLKNILAFAYSRINIQTKIYLSLRISYFKIIIALKSFRLRLFKLS